MSRVTTKTTSPRSRLPVVGGGLAIVSLAIAFAWYSTRPPVELSEHGYDVTLALYRICNQRSDEGIKQIESELASGTGDSHANSAGDDAIRAILEQAKSGNWIDATRACRRLMDDQVRR